MICPHCNSKFPLTWKRYLKSPLGNHICPDCHKKSALKSTLKYYMSLAAFWTLYYICAIYFVKNYLHGGIKLIQDPFGFGCVIAVGCILVLPVDKEFMESLRNLEKNVE